MALFGDYILLIITNLDSAGEKILVPAGPGKFREWLGVRESITGVGVGNDGHLWPQMKQEG